MSSKFGENIRGLTVFISDIRNCKSKEAERKRINKELANIRSKFKNDRLDGYQKKKYVCKLVFIFLLGNDIDFGYQEAVNLLSSTRFSEKQIGYLFVSVMIGGNHELSQLINQSIRHDLESSIPVFNTLAMQCIANVANKDMAEQLAKDVPPLLVSDRTNAVKQTAALCLLRLLRVNPQAVSIDQYAVKIVQLINEKHMGVVTAACSLLEELAHINSLGFSECVPLAVTKLFKIVTSSSSDWQDYTYYFVAAPWVSVKLMRLLQCFDSPTDPVVRARLCEALDSIVNKAQEPNKSKKVQYTNAKHCVLFEAINLILHFQGDPSLQVRAANLLGGFLTHKDVNMRYLSLESLSHLAISDLTREAIKKHQSVVLETLMTEKDISVRQRAIDLLYAMCDQSNAVDIVGQLMPYLEKADYSIRETLVLKIAILAEKFATDFKWYVDIILNLIRLAGDYVGEEVWYRIIQIIINKQDVQGYAAKTCFEALQAPACHENMVKVGGYILGEFGNLIAGDARSSPLVQFQLLHSKYHLCSASTRGILLSSYVKFINLFPEIKPQIQEVLNSDNQSRNSNQELQQRAIEYNKLATIGTSDLLATVLEEMPAFPERESSLLSKLHESAPWTAKLHKDVTSPASQPSPEREPSSTVSNGPTQSPAVNIGMPIEPLINTDLITPSTTTNSGGNLLVDVFAVEPVATPPAPPTGDIVSPGAEEGFNRFLTKSNGVLFENDMLQIGVKSDFKKNLGRIGVFFGNKSTSPLKNFSSALTLPGDLASSLGVVAKPIATSIEGGAQVQQVIDATALNIYTEAPRLAITFNLGGTPHSFVLKLPVPISKYLEATTLSSADFFQRWKALASPQQEAQSVFPAKYPIEYASAKTKLLGFGLSVISDIDPNPDNFVSAGIVNTTSVLVGCLVRLEPNKQTKMYRLTIRTSNETISKEFCDILSKQF
ncbi:AP-2 complex subunit alpha-2-like [Halichondria panicea]|uniref:AP-2 complex subunit alpha-2-like n=1 Tax=Halichondria panicea TaxID=6063 RepID=UPI00312B4613